MSTDSITREDHQKMIASWKREELEWIQDLAEERDISNKLAEALIWISAYCEFGCKDALEAEKKMREALAAYDKSRPDKRDQCLES